MTLRPETGRLLIFLHIHKTGGTSLRRILYRHVSPEHRLAIYHHAQQTAAQLDRRIEQLQHMPDVRKQHIRLILGHFNFGIHQFFARPCSYVTILRDPVEQAAASYRFGRGAPNRGFHDLASKLSLEDFLHDLFVRQRATNQYVRIFSGYGGLFDGQPQAPDRVLDPLPEDALAKAKHTLQTHFSGIGITERFDESLLLFKKSGLTHNIYHYKPHYSPDLQPQSIRDLYGEYNPLDLEFYTFAKDLFEHQWQTVGPQREDLLRQFRARNRVWSHYYHLAIRLGTARDQFHHFRGRATKHLLKR